MFLDLIIQLIAMLLRIVDFLLTPFQIPSDMLFSVSYVLQLVLGWNYIVPVFAVINVFVFLIEFELAFLIVRFMLGFISLIRGGGKISV